MASRKIQSAGGLGESKIFCAPEGSLGETAVDRLQKCHIGGVEIARMNLDPQVLSALSYCATDEGIAEQNARPNVREGSGVELGKDGFDKALQERRDDVKDRDKPLWDSRDPLKEVADKYAVPGMRAKFLSRARIKDEGGTGMHEVVKRENGDPVTVKGMILAHAPVAAVAARNARYRERGAELIKQIGEKHVRENGGDAALAQQGKQ